jgi:DHA2 family lincomycin resistance protein-like MFS transporter
VAGAAGVALFIAIMTAQQVKLAASGTVAIEALAGGIRAAFLTGAIGAILAVGFAFLVRKPAAPAMPAAH